VRRQLPALIAVVLAAAGAAVAHAKDAVPRLVFPVVGSVDYHDDFGEPRGGGPHPGNDIVAARRAPVVAVEDGTVGFWTTSRSAGCMLYLHGSSGATYQYIHLNNDLADTNDNKGKCIPGVSYARGLVDGMHVDAGQQIGFVGDSGDADGIHPHLHFEVHPQNGDAVDPYPFLKRALHLLVAAPPSGTAFTLKLTGTVVSGSDDELTLNVSSLASWPSHLKQTKLNRLLTLAVPADAAVTGDLASAGGVKAVVWTKPAPGTVDALSGSPNALSAERVDLP
jgi:hypothetical protein